MHIAIVCHKRDTYNNYAAYLKQLLFVTGVHDFSLVYLSEYEKKKEPFTGNIYIIIEAGADTIIGLQTWSYLQLPYILKKIKANMVICLSGFVSIPVKIPQVLVIGSSYYFENNTAAKTSWQKLSLKQINKSVQKAAVVITYSGHALAAIEKFCAAKLSNGHIIRYTASREFTVLEWPEKVLIKGSYTDNKEFFAAVINDREEDYMALLKAFSVFKKWQQSSMKLLLLAGNGVSVEKCSEKLSAYKHRNDVKLLQNYTDKQFALITGSAYCLLHNNSDENLLPLIQAAQCAVPLIAVRTAAVEEYAARASLFSEGNNYEEIANKMIMLYKNETLREKLSSIGRDLSLFYDQQKESDRLQQIILTLLI